MLLMMIVMTMMMTIVMTTMISLSASGYLPNFNFDF